MFIDQPQFDGSPLPPFYAGMTLAEMLTNTPPVTNAVRLHPSACTNLDDSPELRRHPILDQFVADMGNDPIALANYVLNQIDLTDPMDYNDNGNVARGIHQSGRRQPRRVGDFPGEARARPPSNAPCWFICCGRRGCPPCYVFPPHNGLQILDARLSRMLKFQVQGGFSEAGQLYTTNTMIAVNYPVGGGLHRHQLGAYLPVVEGLRDQTRAWTCTTTCPPTTAAPIPGCGITSMATPTCCRWRWTATTRPGSSSRPSLQQTLLQNHPGVSVDDLGVQIVNRRHYYARWQDFPTPTWVTNTSTPLESLTASGITNVDPR